MSIRPLQDRVVVRRLESETTTAGGIVIPDSASEKPNQGEVVAVGPDRILFGKYSPNEIKLDGEELLIIKESDILAVIEQDKKMEKAA